MSTFSAESKRAAFGDSAKVAVQLVLGHAAAVIAYADCAVFLVKVNADNKIIRTETDGGICQRAEIELVECV